MSDENNLRVRALAAAVSEFNKLDTNKESDETSLHPTMNAYLDAIGNDERAKIIILDDTKPSIKKLFTELGFEIPEFTDPDFSTLTHPQDATDIKLKVLQLIENHLYNNFNDNPGHNKSINIAEIKLSGGRRRLPRKSAKRRSNRHRSNRRRSNCRRRTARK